MLSQPPAKPPPPVAQAGRHRIVLCSPERLSNPHFLDAIQPHLPLALVGAMPGTDMRGFLRLTQFRHVLEAGGRRGAGCRARGPVLTHQPSKTHSLATPLPSPLPPAPPYPPE